MWGLITLIDIAKLRTLLKFEGITLEDVTDDELKVLVDSKLSELEGLTGLNIKPSHRLETKTKFKGDILRLDFYPVLDFNSIRVNGHCLPPTKYHLNSRLGLVYFHRIIHGNVTVKYLSGADDEFIESVVAPLIKDMVAYTVTYNRLGLGGPVSSIKEGDVSVNYDTNNSYGKRISNAIADVKLKYNTARLRWL